MTASAALRNLGPKIVGDTKARAVRVNTGISVQVPARVLTGLNDGRIGAFLISAQGRDWLITGGQQAKVWLRANTARLRVRILGSKVLKSLDSLPGVATKMNLEAPDITGNAEHGWSDVRHLATTSGEGAPYLLVRAVPVGKMATHAAMTPPPKGVTVITRTDPAPEAHFVLHPASMQTYQDRLRQAISELPLTASVRHGAEALAAALVAARTCWVGEKISKTARRAAGVTPVRAALTALTSAGALTERSGGGPVVARRLLTGLWATQVRVIDSTAEPREPPPGTWVYRWDTPLDDPQVQVHQADENAYRQRLREAVTSAEPPTELAEAALALVDAVAASRRSFVSKRSRGRAQYGRNSTIMSNAVHWLEDHRVLTRSDGTLMVHRRLVEGLRMASRPAPKCL